MPRPDYGDHDHDRDKPIRVEATVTVNLVDPSAKALLTEILSFLTSFDRKFDRNMAAVTQDIRDIVLKFDAATDEIAKDLQALRDQIHGGMTAAEAEEIKASLTAKVARLEVLGQDPADPVPAPNPNAPGNTNDPNAPNFRGNR